MSSMVNRHEMEQVIARQRGEVEEQQDYGHDAWVLELG